MNASPTVLLIDVGNSRLKYWFHHPSLHPLHAETEAPACAHDGAQLPIDTLRAHWREQAQHYGAPREIRISHVAGYALYEQLDALCAQLWPDSPIRRLRTQAQQPQLQLSYQAQQMGSDRYAQILGAQNICPQRDHVIIGAGTALTLDGVCAATDAGGRHIGGAITAGVRLMRTALHQYTAQLPLEGGQLSPHAPDNTADALASGVLLAAVGAIAQFVERYFAADAQPTLLFCGGDARTLMQHCADSRTLASLPMQHAPALCLLGLLTMNEQQA